MKLKTIAVGTLLSLMIPAAGMAHGHLWYDMSAHVPKFKKLVIFPVTDVDGKTYLMDENEQSFVYKMNDYMDKQLVRKLNFRTISLGRTLMENKEIRTDEEKYKSLYQQFPSEEERGRAVAEITMADGYLVPKIRERRVEQHLSPETWVNVEMRSWTEETSDGPQGARTYNERKWTERHRIPEAQMYLHHFDLEHAIYDGTGKKVLAYENNAHVYSKTDEKIFKELVDEFRKDFKDVRKDKEDDRAKTGIRIGFRDIALPSDIADDDCLVKSVYFGMKNGARKLKNVKIDVKGDSVIPNKYYVKGQLSRFSLHRRWVDPYVTLSDKLVSSKKATWRDRSGEEHEYYIKQYVTEINDHYGHWAYSGTVSGDFQLVNAVTDQPVLSHSAVETDDKTSDAYLHLMKAFYKKVDKQINGK